MGSRCGWRMHFAQIRCTCERCSADLLPGRVAANIQYGRLSVNELLQLSDERPPNLGSQEAPICHEYRVVLQVIYGFQARKVCRSKRFSSGQAQHRADDRWTRLFDQVARESLAARPLGVLHTHVWTAPRTDGWNRRAGPPEEGCGTERIFRSARGSHWRQVISRSSPVSPG